MKNFNSFFILLISLSVSLSSLAQEDYVSSEEPKIQITTSNQKIYVGTIVEDTGEKIKLDTEEFGVIILNKSNIVKQEVFDETTYQQLQDNSKSNKEYTLAPSAFNLGRGVGSAQTHYFGYWNFEKGISDNFSVDLGVTYPLIMPLRVGFKASAKIVDGLRIGLKGNAFTFLDIYGFGPAPSTTSTVRLAIPVFFLLQANPMITVGNERTNLTIGGSFSYLTRVSEIGFGGFFGAQIGLKDNWSFYTEFISAFGANQTFFNQTYSASLGAKYHRSERKTWTFALSSAVFPTSQRVYNSTTGSYTSQDVYFVLPLPYVGYRVTF